MKKAVFILSALILLTGSLLTACGSSSGTAAGQPQTGSATETVNTEAVSETAAAPDTEAETESEAAASAPAVPGGSDKVTSGFYDYYEIKVLPTSAVLSVRETSGDYYRLMDADMNVLSDQPFIYLNDNSGFIEFALENTDNCIGALDRQGNITVPARYGTLEIKSDRWIIGLSLKKSNADSYDYKSFGGSYYLVDHADAYYCGTLVGTLTRDEYSSSNAFGDYLYVDPREGSGMFFDKEFRKAEPHSEHTYNEYEYSGSEDKVWHLGSGTEAFAAGCTLTPEEVATKAYNKKGVLYGLQGEELCSTADFSVNSFVRGYASTRNNAEKYGILSEEGIVIVPCEYDKIDLIESHVKTGYVCAYKEDSLIYISLADGSAVETGMPKASLKDLSAPFSTRVGDDGKYRVITAKAGVLPESFDEVGSVYSSYKLISVGKDGGFGIIDLDGNSIVDCDKKFTNKTSLTMSQDGTLIVGKAADGYYVFRNTP